VFTDWGRVSVGVAAQAQVEEETSCFLRRGRSGVLDEECKGRDGAGCGWGDRSDEEALREGKAASREGMDCYSGLGIGFHGITRVPQISSVVNCSKLDLRGVQLLQNLDRAVDSPRRQKVLQATPSGIDLQEGRWLSEYLQHILNLVRSYEEQKQDIKVTSLGYGRHREKYPMMDIQGAGQL
jgi:hypothetical protein